MSISHASDGLVIGYTLASSGTLIGLLTARASLKRILAFPLIAIPAFIVGGILWSLIGPAPVAGHPESAFLNIIRGAFILGSAGLVGHLAAKLRSWGSIQHQRGTVIRMTGPRTRFHMNAAQVCVAIGQGHK